MEFRECLIHMGLSLVHAAIIHSESREKEGR